jgi:hypothetical protein
MQTSPRLMLAQWRDDTTAYESGVVPITPSFRDAAEQCLCFEIENQLDFHRLHHRQLGWLRSPPHTNQHD